MALIEVSGLEKTYRSDDVATPVLRGLDFAISAGEFVAVMGPSGSGKSTLLHILGFLDMPTGGSYRFEGKTMTDYTSAELARIRNKEMGFVFQAFNLLPRTSVLENVQLPLVYSKVRRSEWAAHTMSAIEEVGLAHRLHHEPSQLSGGERQRVAIARALVNSPKVIFADEPTGNLDSKSGHQILQIIQRLNQDHGHTVILITHDTQIAEYSRRIIRFLDGRIESDTGVISRPDARTYHPKPTL